MFACIYTYIYTHRVNTTTYKKKQLFIDQRSSRK